MAAIIIFRPVYLTQTIDYNVFMEEYPPQFIEEMKAALLQHKDKLEEDLAELHPHTEMGDEADENADEVGVDEVSRDLIARMKHDLQKIEEALEKIEQGTYGFDEDGKMIGEARLRALPWADTAL